MRIRLEKAAPQCHGEILRPTTLRFGDFRWSLHSEAVKKSLAIGDKAE